MSKAAEWIGDLKAYIRIKILDLPTDTVVQSVENRRDKQSHRFESKRVSDFLFVPLRSFFSATLAKRWMVQFRQGFALYNDIDSITTQNNYIYVHLYWRRCLTLCYFLYMTRSFPYTEKWECSSVVQTQMKLTLNRYFGLLCDTRYDDYH